MVDELGARPAGEPHGLVFGLRLDRAGGGKPVDWAEVEADPTGADIEGDLWVHLDRGVERVREWLSGVARLPHPVVHGLMAPTPRPKFVRYQASESYPDGFLLVLRGVNLNEGADPEDMVALRIWVDEHRVITVRGRLVISVRGVHDEIDRGAGPAESSDLVVRLATALLERMEPVLDRLDEELTGVEEGETKASPEALRESIREIRLRVIRLRRYLAPQREALLAASGDLPGWFPRAHREMLKSAYERTSRVLEDLDELRDRANVMYEDLSMRVAERMNRVSTQLTVIAAVFLPMGLIAGVWGMNLTLPLEGTVSGFWLVMVAMLLGGVGIYVFVRRSVGRGG